MGRDLRRVPLDFSWPLDEVWEGFLQPDELDLPKCSACDGSGLSPEASAIENTFYAHMIGGRNADALAWHDKIGQDEVDNLVAEDRLWDFTRHIDRSKGGWTDNDPPTPPTAAEVNAWERSSRGFGHDSINRWILVRFRCERLGIPLDCSACSGHGDIGTDEQRATRESWQPTDPPEGEGYQLWESVSEGSPITPVFESLDALCEHAAVHCTTFGFSRATVSEWKRMLDDGLVYHREGNHVFL